MLVKDILSKKGNKVYTITADHTVKDAVEMLAKYNVGALVVVDEKGDPEGILSERDVIRLLSRSYHDIGTVKVSEIMTRNVIVCEKEDDVEYVEKVMVEKRIRHIPVIENNRLAGIISIGDVMKSLLKDSQLEIKYLRDYVTGNYPN